MAFTIKVRTLPGAPMLCEYECPSHGRFERIVERDQNGDPPSVVACDVPVMLERPMRAFDTAFIGGRRQRRPTPCALDSELAISAPSIKFWSRDPVAIGRASKSDEKDPRALDTEPLATGRMTKAEWRKWQRGISQERRYQKRLKAGRISKRIQVGGG